MTCRGLKVGVLFFCMLMLGSLWKCQKVSAEEIGQLPEGDILIVYSDDASVSERDNLMLLVENLTYQNYVVTYAPATECVGKLKNFENILFYKVERYPGELLWEVYEEEKAEDVRLLFVGNRFLEDYLQQTARTGKYLKKNTQVARLQYAFSSTRQMEALVLEDNFLFLREYEESNGNLEASEQDGYFIAKSRNLYHIPLTGFENSLVRAAAFREISQWLWRRPYPMNTYAQYIVLNKVYPFQNPKRLLAAVKKLVELEQPFIITVMPIYEHGDYPAMERFCEVLRYAQANGGMVMIHTPLNQMPQFDAGEVNEALTTAVEIYVEHGIYPMGLQVPRSWMFREDVSEIMVRFRTILVAEEEDRLVYSDVVSNTNSAYLKEHQWIAPTIVLDTEGTSYLTNYSSAVYFDIMEEEVEFDKRLKACMESEVPLKNIWDADHRIQTEQDEILYQNGYLTVNGEPGKLVYEPMEEQPEFEYKRNVLERMSRDLTSQNRKLLAAVFLVSILFVWFIIMARYRNRKRFLIPISNNPWDGLDDEALSEVLEQQLMEREAQERLQREQGENAEDDYDIRNLPPRAEYDIVNIPAEDDYDIKD